MSCKNNLLHLGRRLTACYKAVTHIMNDDVDAAEEHLSKGSSPFHLVPCSLHPFRPHSTLTYTFAARQGRCDVHESYSRF